MPIDVKGRVWLGTRTPAFRETVIVGRAEAGNQRPTRQEPVVDPAEQFGVVLTRDVREAVERHHGVE